MNIKKLIYLPLLAFAMLSCDNWLDNPPYDKVTGEELYKDEAGLQIALNGLYLNLLNSNMYGQNLTVTVTDAMAQLYFAPSDYSFYNHSTMNFSNIEGTISSIWTVMYKHIAECNVFMAELEKVKGMISENQYKLFRGEALGIRTYLYFDIFRLWGPVTDDLNKLERKMIPYYNVETSIPQPYETGLDFINFLFEDIEEVIELLAKDPILNEGVVESTDFWSFRNLRFNYYAAQVLKARMCLHIGDTDNTYLLTTALLNNLDPDTGNEINFSSSFPLRNATEINERDPMYFTEVILGMHDTRREQMYRDNFSTGINASRILCATTEFVAELYEFEDARRGTWATITDQATSVSLTINTRYRVSRSSEFRYSFIPLIRLSEVYLMAAESADNDTDKAHWLEILRLNRGFQANNTADHVDNFFKLIQKEYMREFYAEGQFFYFLKRNNISKFKGTNAERTMSYVWPIPDNETDNRN